MKTLFTILAVAAVGLTGCKDNNAPKVLDPLAKISIRAATNPTGVASKANYLSPTEVVRQTTDIFLQNPKIGNEPHYNVMIADEQKDLTTPKIMMWGMWVILNNELSPSFIEAYDVILVTRQNQDKTKPVSDTLAYVPNAQLRAAEKGLNDAFVAGNYELVYQLFDQAYRFTPINGADWLKLKAKGEN